MESVELLPIDGAASKRQVLAEDAGAANGKHGERAEASPAGFRRLLKMARGGSDEALARLLELFRSYLTLAAENSLDSDVRPKVGASDLVQESIIEARRDFGRFRGQSEAELRGWLKRILVNNLLNQYRIWRLSRKRQVSREVVFTEQGLHDSALIDRADTTPSEIAAGHEERDRLHAALERLPAHYREVLELRHREGLGFPQIGRRMNRSADAVRMLWSRAFGQLGVALGMPNEGVRTTEE
ncbi:MAG: sigma-70 family RNA polymerase sigma factor [Planctomycetes bacterium]|nr:sigma-70 family RNA polymerase sigma factor [Planctomycetota bacterium]